MKRLFGLEKQFKKKPDYVVRYSKAIDQYIALGHVRRLEVKELLGQEGKTWYLPHHGVEQNGKLRVVFDASSRHQGQSLNDYLLQGPDVMTPLLGVLVRFRERAHAVSVLVQERAARVPSYLAVASKTTRFFPGLLTFMNEW